MRTSKNILEQINQARYIAMVCNKNAAALRVKLSATPRGKSIDVIIKNMNKKDAISRRIELLEGRARKVWFAVTDYQGKYINWKDLQKVEGKTYCGILELLEASFTHPSFKEA